MIEKYSQALREYVLSHEPNYGDGQSILTLLYEAYSDAIGLSENVGGGLMTGMIAFLVLAAPIAILLGGTNKYK